MNQTTYKRLKAISPEKYMHSSKRVKKTFVVLCYYTNGNYKKVMKRNSAFVEADFYRIKPFDLWKIAKQQKLRCALTGLPLTFDTVSVDHIIPISKGGLNAPDNLRLLHVSVNRMKLDYSDKEFSNICRLVIEQQNRIRPF